MENASVQEASGAQAESAEVQEREQQQAAVAAPDYRIVSFSLGGRGYAFDIMCVKEIVKAGYFTYVPNTAPFVMGVYNLRGDIIPVIDLRIFFNLSSEENLTDKIESMIVLTVDEQNYGVIVDGMSKVASVYSGSIQPPHPIFGDINVKYIQGVVEHQGRLYVLLDAESIFKGKEVAAQHDVSIAPSAFASPLPALGKSAGSSQDASPQAEEVEMSPAQELSFIRDSLASMSRFYVSQVNEDWVNSRFQQWTSMRGAENLQLHTQADVNLFLSPFLSPCNGALWSDQYLKEVSALLPDNPARQINVWNVGCGKGFESYSVAVMMKERYPNARIRIYANDMDLLDISSAPLITLPDAGIPEIYKPYITKNVSGSQVFCQEIRDMVMFEYHDCSNRNSLPSIDLVVCRDVLSFMDAKKQSSVIYDISENLKSSGIVLLGANETMPKNVGWKKKTRGSVSVFARE